LNGDKGKHLHNTLAAQGETGTRTPEWLTNTAQDKAKRARGKGQGAWAKGQWVASPALCHN